MPQQNPEQPGIAFCAMLWSISMARRRRSSWSRTWTGIWSGHCPGTTSISRRRSRPSFSFEHSPIWPRSDVCPTSLPGAQLSRVLILDESLELKAVPRCKAGRNYGQYMDQRRLKVNVLLVKVLSNLPKAGIIPVVNSRLGMMHRSPSSLPNSMSTHREVRPRLICSRRRAAQMWLKRYSTYGRVSTLDQRPKALVRGSGHTIPGCALDF